MLENNLVYIYKGYLSEFYFSESQHGNYIQKKWLVGWIMKHLSIATLPLALNENNINLFLDDYRNSSWNYVTVKATISSIFISIDMTLVSSPNCGLAENQGKRSWQFSLYIRSNYGVCSKNFF